MYGNIGSESGSSYPPLEILDPDLRSKMEPDPVSFFNYDFFLPIPEINISQHYDLY